MPTHSRSRSLTRRLVTLFVITVLVLPVAALIAAKVADQRDWARTVAVTSGSMTGYANEGDLVVALPKPAKDVRVGAVLVRPLAKPGEYSRYITHRVTKVDQANGAVTVRTKGDATEAEDVEATRLGDTAMVVRTVVPKVGYASWFIAMNRGLLIGGYIALALVYLLTGWAFDRVRARQADRRQGAPRADVETA